MPNISILGQISKGDQLLPLFIVERMSSMPGLPGLAVAGIFSGSLSTVSSAINSLAAVTLEVKPWIFEWEVNHYYLTRFVKRSKIYIKWRGGWSTPPYYFIE